MLLTTGIVALSRKIADEKAKKREARQGHLEIGDSQVAKQAFDTGIDRRGTEIKYEDPTEIAPPSPAVQSPSTVDTQSDSLGISQSRQSSVRSPARSEKGLLDPTSPYDKSPITPSDDLSVRNSMSTQPPPYSPDAQSPSDSTPLSSVYSRDIDGKSLSTWDTRSISTQSTNSDGTHALRIKTIGSDLKSGFPYHPSLFELKVHPEKWNAFTTQVVESTKFSMKDHAQIWGAATATALTGAIGTSIFVGRSMNRSAQENKVKAGLTNLEDGGLGAVLQRWNDEYFSNRGLYVHLELSESAMKNPGQRSKAFRKSTLMYSQREDRERKREERKFVIVVTSLDSDGQPTEALEELGVAEGVAEKRAAEEGPVEIGSSDEPFSTISELPGEGQVMPAELPAPEPSSAKDSLEPPSGYIEMSSDNTLLLEKMHLEGGREDSPREPKNDLIPEPLSVTGQASAKVDS